MKNHKITAAQCEVLDLLGSKLPNLVIYQYILYPDQSAKFIYLSENIYNFIGVEAAKIKENPNILFDLIDDEIKAEWRNIRSKKIKDGSSVLDKEIEIERVDGVVQRFHVTQYAIELEDGSILNTGIHVNITSIANKTMLFDKTIRELELLNKINDHILNIKSEKILFDEICKSMVLYGGYKLAWISKKPDSKEIVQVIKPLSAYGKTDYLDKLYIDLNNELLSRGPTATVLRKGGSIVLNDFTIDERYFPFLERSKAAGFASIAAFALQHEKTERYVLTIYSSEINAFNEHELLVLNRIAQNVSIAINALNNNKEKLEALNKLKERNKELHAVYKISDLLNTINTEDDSIIKQIPSLIQNSLSYPECSGVQVVLNGKSYNTENFIENKSQHSIEILNDNMPIGVIQLSYIDELCNLEKCADFNDEELKLFETVADMLANYISKKENLSELKKSEAYLKSIFNNSPSEHIILDTNFNLVFFNNQIYTGYKEHFNIELKRGESYLKYILPENLEIYKSLFRQCLEQKEFIRYESTVKITNKSVYYVLQLLPIVINEQVHGLSLTIINVTEQKKMELQQQKITQDLINRNRDLEQFGYTISHNLRSPLTNIIGLYNLLKTSPNEEERNYILEKIGTSSHRLDNIVKDLNEILQRNKSITENKATIHFYAIIKNIEASIELLLTNSKTTIEIDVKDAPEIYTIKTYLRSILENLITNSIKYAKQNENPHIIIKTCKKDKNIILSFKDNGIGIDMEKHKNQIFGLYKRFDNTKEGKGLGLYMVKSQVEQLGGKIEILSEVGIGTEFILTLPEK